MLLILVWAACSVSTLKIQIIKIISFLVMHNSFKCISSFFSVSSTFLNVFMSSDVPVESLRLRFALLQSLNNTLESFFLPLVELRQTHTYQNSIAALLCEAKGEWDLSNLLWNLVCLASIFKFGCSDCHCEPVCFYFIWKYFLDLEVHSNILRVALYG